jgi:threonylcarbamoyladenosine tRNA methylthiotransferase MtaB
MKVFLDTIGCRLNQSEIESYARQFRLAGHAVVATPEDADLAVVNTCAVTAAAVSDSRQQIRQAARAGVKELVVTGCWSSLHPDAAVILPSVSRVVPNLEKDNLVANLLQLPGETFDLEPLARQPLPGVRLRTRAFIKVQDGCDNRCTFCVTTIARGRGRSRPVAEVLADVRAVVQGDESTETAAKEIILTGVHLGSWGQDFSPPLHLRNLILAILSETYIPRLRLSSLEPWDLDEEFFSLWENLRLCRHLHLPLQSGCAATLRRMAQNLPGHLLPGLCSPRIPDVAVTAMIAGFPGETSRIADRWVL